MVELSPTDRFLAQSLRNIRSGERAAWAINDSADWQETWARIDYHGIALLLHNHAGLLAEWPQGLCDRIAEEARLIVLWETTHGETLRELLKALDEAGIESVLMKGTALAYALHDDPATRRRGDTDLLVHPKDQARTRSILKRLGWYRKDDPHGLYYQEGWLHDAAGFFVHSVDLHWEPSDRPILHGILPIADFFARKQPVVSLGQGAFRPDLALMIVHAAINQKWHAVHGYAAEEGNVISPRRLIWSVDFELMASAMDDGDWTRLTDHCERNGIGPLIAEALRGMQQDLEGELPSGALETLEAIPLNPDMRSYYERADGLHQFKLDLRYTKGLRKKLRLVTMRAFPPRDHLVEKYPAAKGWPTLLLQGRMLIETAARALRKAVSS